MLLCNLVVWRVISILHKLNELAVKVISTRKFGLEDKDNQGKADGLGTLSYQELVIDTCIHIIGYK
jgi:hypothetical protein